VDTISLRWRCAVASLIIRYSCPRDKLYQRWRGWDSPLTRDSSEYSCENVG